ncbi:ABC transporter substrate-binding protein [Halarcobacter ebronensis]|uniref:ABC transporter substrate-binding protein n=1 Tax=Halarcobacter ebronensis TaxID=1462615 RepID=A0A4Q1AKV6_9BACT|nr:ABC transporter substrate-binding protein [Halarcobacter ebronensis]QKF81624.1 glycerol-3-phosphate ABC transporter, periplasmic substrate-binding protein [Halarcobacter ebronensis]RXK05550.1 ABC transporter substrate-binding protein [Halarcobacter ebronensis]
MFRFVKRAALVSVLAASFLSSANAQKTELTMYYPISVGGPLTKIVDSMVEEFEKQNPDIDVNAIYAGNYNDARIKSLAALKAGQPAQLAVMFSIDTYDLIEQDAIISFSDIVKSDKDKEWLNSFYPALMENGTTLGKVWAIPFQRSTIIMYYNKDAFRKAGLDPNKPPKDWDEMVTMGKKLTTNDQWGLMIPSTGYPYWMFGALAKQNGEILMNSEGTKTYFDNPNVVKALEYWKDLSNKYNIMPKGTIEWGTLRKNFLSGKTAMMWHSTGNLTAVKNEATFDFGVAMLPASKMRGTPTGGGNFYIFKKTTPQEREASMRLIKFMTSPENSAKWSMGTGYIGISKAAYNTPDLKKYVEEFPPAKVARDQLEFATAELSTYQTGRVRKILDDTIQAVLTDKKEPKEALEEAQKEASKLLRNYK